MTITQLNYLLACYCIVFSVAGLYFFVKARKLLDEVEDLLNEGETMTSHEGTDTD